MKNTLLALSILVAVVASGCTGWSGTGIMQTDPNDPVGSASIGTGSVTSNSLISEEAKAAGIGLGP